MLATDVSARTSIADPDLARLVLSLIMFISAYSQRISMKPCRDQNHGTCLWCLSSKQRNRKAHAMHSNSPERARWESTIEQPGANFVDYQEFDLPIDCFFRLRFAWTECRMEHVALHS